MRVEVTPQEKRHEKGMLEGQRKKWPKGHKSEVIEVIFVTGIWNLSAAHSGNVFHTRLLAFARCDRSDMQ